jgi:hypothetical protein
MTKLKSRPKVHYQAFLVEPEPDFAPKNWRDKPRSFRVIEYIGAKQFLGRADAWRFLHNHKALESNQTKVWAIVVE